MAAYAPLRIQFMRTGSQSWGIQCSRLPSGATVTRIETTSPAIHSILKIGDTLISVNGRQVANMDETEIRKLFDAQSLDITFRKKQVAKEIAVIDLVSDDDEDDNTIPVPKAITAAPQNSRERVAVDLTNESPPLAPNSTVASSQKTPFTLTPSVLSITSKHPLPEEIATTRKKAKILKTVVLASGEIIVKKEPLGFGEANYPGEVEEIAIVRHPNTTDVSSLSTMNVEDDDSDEVQLVGGNTSGLCDMPHQREACSRHAFRQDEFTTNKSSCPMCYCYVCEVKAAECRDWVRHCHATHKKIKWKSEREALKSKLFLLMKPEMRVLFFSQVGNMLYDNAGPGTAMNLGLRQSLHTPQEYDQLFRAVGAKMKTLRQLRGADPQGTYRQLFLECAILLTTIVNRYGIVLNKLYKEAFAVTVELLFMPDMDAEIRKEVHAVLKGDGPSSRTMLAMLSDPAIDLEALKDPRSEVILPPTFCTCSADVQLAMLEAFIGAKVWRLAVLVAMSQQSVSVQARTIMIVVEAHLHHKDDMLHYLHMLDKIPREKMLELHVSSLTMPRPITTIMLLSFLLEIPQVLKNLPVLFTSAFVSLVGMLCASSLQLAKQGEDAVNAALKLKILQPIWTMPLDFDSVSDADARAIFLNMCHRLSIFRMKSVELSPPSVSASALPIVPPAVATPATTTAVPVAVENSVVPLHMPTFVEIMDICLKENEISIVTHTACQNSWKATETLATSPSERHKKFLTIVVDKLGASPGAAAWKTLCDKISWYAAKCKPTAAASVASAPLATTVPSTAAAIQAPPQVSVADWLVSTGNAVLASIRPDSHSRPECALLAEHLCKPTDELFQRVFGTICLARYLSHSKSTLAAAGILLDRGGVMSFMSGYMQPISATETAAIYAKLPALVVTEYGRLPASWTSLYPRILPKDISATGAGGVAADNKAEKFGLTIDSLERWHRMLSKQDDEASTANHMLCCKGSWKTFVAWLPHMYEEKESWFQVNKAKLFSYAQFVLSLFQSSLESNANRVMFKKSVQENRMWIGTEECFTCLIYFCNMVVHCDGQFSMLGDMNFFVEYLTKLPVSTGEFWHGWQFWRPLCVWLINAFTLTDKFQETQLCYQTITCFTMLEEWSLLAKMAGKLNLLLGVYNVSYPLPGASCQYLLSLMLEMPSSELRFNERIESTMARPLTILTSEKSISPECLRLMKMLARVTLNALMSRQVIECDRDSVSITAFKLEMFKTIESEVLPREIVSEHNKLCCSMERIVATALAIGSTQLAGRLIQKRLGFLEDIGLEKFFQLVWPIWVTHITTPEAFTTIIDAMYPVFNVSIRKRFSWVHVEQEFDKCSVPNSLQSAQKREKHSCGTESVNVKQLAAYISGTIHDMKALLEHKDMTQERKSQVFDWYLEYGKTVKPASLGHISSAPMDLIKVCCKWYSVEQLAVGWNNLSTSHTNMWNAQFVSTVSTLMQEHRSHTECLCLGLVQALLTANHSISDDVRKELMKLHETISNDSALMSRASVFVSSAPTAAWRIQSFQDSVDVLGFIASPDVLNMGTVLNIMSGDKTGMYKAIFDRCNPSRSLSIFLANRDYELLFESLMETQSLSFSAIVHDLESLLMIEHFLPVMDDAIAPAKLHELLHQEFFSKGSCLYSLIPWLFEGNKNATTMEEIKHLGSTVMTMCDQDYLVSAIFKFCTSFCEESIVEFQMACVRAVNGLNTSTGSDASNLDKRVWGQEAVFDRLLTAIATSKKTNLSDRLQQLGAIIRVHDKKTLMGSSFLFTDLSAMKSLTENIMGTDNRIEIKGRVPFSSQGIFEIFVRDYHSSNDTVEVARLLVLFVQSTGVIGVRVIEPHVMSVLRKLFEKPTVHTSLLNVLDHMAASDPAVNYMRNLTRLAGEIPAIEQVQQDVMIAFARGTLNDWLHTFMSLYSKNSTVTPAHVLAVHDCTWRATLGGKTNTPAADPQQEKIMITMRYWSRNLVQKIIPKIKDTCIEPLEQHLGLPQQCVGLEFLISNERFVAALTYEISMKLLLIRSTRMEVLWRHLLLQQVLSDTEVPSQDYEQRGSISTAAPAMTSTASMVMGCMEKMCSAMAEHVASERVTQGVKSQFVEFFTVLVSAFTKNTTDGIRTKWLELRKSFIKQISRKKAVQSAVIHL